MSFHAETTWNVWRRILREPNIQSILRAQDLDSRVAETAFEGEEVKIARHYQAHFKDAEWFVTSYRFRLVSAFINAIEIGAPLTHRVLLAHGQDVRHLAEVFFDGDGWFDDGPFVYRLAAKILDWLPNAKTLPNLLEISSVTRLEAAAVGVLRDAASIEESAWTRPVPDRAAILSGVRDGRTLVWTGLVRTVETDHDVAPLFSVKGAEGDTAPDLPQRISHFAAYLPSPTQKHRFARIQPMDYDFSQTLVSGGAVTAGFVEDNISSIAKFSKIRAIKLSGDSP